MLRVLVMNGPNLNLLGTRETDVYGTLTLGQIEAMIAERAAALGVDVSFFQSNHEGGLIDRYHEAVGSHDGVVLNPGAYTHYSYALRDAIVATSLPTVEVHLSDIDAREDFRAISVTAPVCLGQIAGLGAESYLVGLERLVSYLREEER
ncbi:MAG: type II 3-dehydroquinate dehydratase [Coriobacteriia bacterium]|nr:type II 3-dehydroquinate dehydratase [Actinomycetota bacterium]MDZ4166233.1 type II 3-dehydroquinate dehydratase [Coriobacteriia bacterium]